MTNGSFQRLLLRELKEIKKEQIRHRIEFLEMKKIFKARRYFDFCRIVPEDKDNTNELSVCYVRAIVNKSKWLLKRIKSKHTVFSRMILVIGFVTVVYLCYIIPLVFLLPWIEALGFERNVVKILGCITISIIPCIVTIKMVNCFRPNIIGYNDDFKWLCDFIAVLIPIVMLFDTYNNYNVVNKEETLITLILFNKYLLGMTFIPWLIRFILGYYILKGKFSNEQ